MPHSIENYVNNMKRHFFPHDTRAVVGQGLITEASRSHSDTPHSVGLLRTSDRPDAEASLRDKTRDTHTRRTFMTPARFASERPQSRSLQLMHKYHTCPCRSLTMPNRAKSRMPRCAPVILKQCRVLHESPRVSWKYQICLFNSLTGPLLNSVATTPDSR